MNWAHFPFFSLMSKTNIVSKGSESDVGQKSVGVVKEAKGLLDTAASGSHDESRINESSKCR